MPNGAAGAHVRCIGPATGHLDGRWHHVAAVISTTSMTTYLDGQEICQMANAQPMSYDLGLDLFVGRHGGGETTFDFIGNLDEVRVYSIALSAARVAALARGSN